MIDVKMQGGVLCSKLVFIYMYNMEAISVKTVHPIVPSGREIKI